MNTNQARVSLAWLLATVLVLLTGLAPALGNEKGRRGCSVRSLDESYGFWRFGKGNFGGPLAGEGIISFDGTGDFYYVLMNNSRDGAIALDESYTGRYTVEPDCTGTLFDDGDGELDRFVVVDNGKGFYAVSVREGVTFNLIATRIH
jgi:hypothetical protein